MRHAALLHVAASEEAYDFATGARLGEEAFLSGCTRLGLGAA
ncbi:MAG: hypothetical protein R3F14_10355 [Polyangiaceae bacterium]